MGNGVCNIAKGRVVEYYNRVKSNDPAASQLNVSLWINVETDNNIMDADNITAVIATALTEATFTNYARKQLADGDLAALPAPDDTNDRYEVDTFSLVEGIDEMFDAADVQKRLLLSGERGVGQVLSSGRRTHCNGDVFSFGHVLPGAVNVLHQAFGQGCTENPLADLCASACQRIDVIDIELCQYLVDAFVEAVGGEKAAVGGRRRRKPARHADTEAVQITDHLAQGSIFPADDLNIIHSKLSKLDDVRFQTTLPCVPGQEMDNRLQISDRAAIVDAAH